MKFFYEEIIQSERDTNESYETCQRLFYEKNQIHFFDCFIHWWLGALLKTFPSISNGIQHFARDLLNPAKGTQMIYSQMISHNFNQWIYRILTAIYHKSIFFLYINERIIKSDSFLLFIGFFFFFFGAILPVELFFIFF